MSDNKETQHLNYEVRVAWCYKMSGGAYQYGDWRSMEEKDNLLNWIDLENRNQNSGYYWLEKRKLGESNAPIVHIVPQLKKDIIETEYVEMLYT